MSKKGIDVSVWQGNIDWNKVKNSGIEFNEIEIYTDKDETNSISINKVVIYTACTKQAVLEALGEAAENIEVEIINE